MGFWYWLGHTTAKVVGKLFLSYRVQNGESFKNLEGGALIVSNHVSFLDPPLVGIGYPRAMYYFARKTLFDHPVANYLFRRMNAIPVNQARPELSALKLVIDLLKKGEKVLIFPEGERTWDGKLKEKGLAGVGMIVCKARVPVLPVRLFGADKAMPRGAKGLRKHPVTLVVGEPIDMTEMIDDPELSTKERYQAIADRLMEEIAKLELSEPRGE